MKQNILLLENIHQDAVAGLQNLGYSVEILPHALDEKALLSRIQDITVLGIRSKTKVTKKVLGKAKKLTMIGTFCIGTDQVDLEECGKRDITVFNAPFSNTRSVVELAVGEMIMLSRGIPEKSKRLHKGEWQKSATGSREIRGKTLGIIGYGNIGMQLSAIAETLGMQVIFYDLTEKLALGRATACESQKRLLQEADIISVHVDGRAENRGLIGKSEFKEMKDGVIFLNLSRGNVVDYYALAEALKDGKVAGAAVDVFPVEPEKNGELLVSPLQNIPNVILTPHIGGSTEEAQTAIAQYMTRKIHSFITKGDTSLSVRKEIR